jgi:hypothetical protein
LRQIVLLSKFGGQAETAIRHHSNLHGATPDHAM